MEVLVGPATFDVSAPVSGRLAEIHGWEDDQVEPGSVLGLVTTLEDDAREGCIDPEAGRRPGDEPPSSRPTT